MVLAELAITQPSFWTWQPSPDTPQFRPLSVSLRSDGEDFLEKFAVGGNLYGDVLYTVWVYAVILGVSIPVLLRRSRSSPPALVVAAFAIGLFMLGVVLFFASPTLIYRIAYPFSSGTVVAPSFFHPVVPTSAVPLRPNTPHQPLGVVVDGDVTNPGTEQESVTQFVVAVLVSSRGWLGRMLTRVGVEAMSQR